MDIKNILNAMIPSPGPVKSRMEKSIKTDSSSDRDANGQRQRQGSGDGRGPLSDSEWVQILQHLKNISAVKEQGWSVERSDLDHRKFVVIKDSEGKVLRRLSERDLSSLLESLTPGGGSSHQETRGQLLRKQA